MKWALALVLAAVSSVTFAAGGSTYPLEQIEPDYTDKVSLQRGLATYSHYCMGCHSLEINLVPVFLRYMFAEIYLSTNGVYGSIKTFSMSA